MNLLLAWRNIWRNKARSLVIMASIALGLTAGIFVLSLYKGMMSGRIRTIIDSESGHLQIHHPGFLFDFDPGFLITNGEVVVKDIASLPQVRCVAQRSITQGMLVSTTGSAGVKIHGILPEEENTVMQLDKKIVEGKGFDKGKKNRILIGKKLAKKMRLHEGSKIVLTFTDTAETIVSSAFRIGGIYETVNAPLDEVNVYVEQSALNNLLGIGSNFHEIAVILKKDSDLPYVKAILKEKYKDVLVEDWKDLSPEMNLMINTVNQLSYIIIVIILFALAFGILNTMLMSVLERTREIGMMVALGTSRARIFFLVLYETIFLTLLGAPFGLLFGYLLTSYLNKNGLSFAAEGQELMQSFGFQSVIYPEFPSENLLFIIFMVVVTALISSLLPALKALRLQPVEALRK